MEIGFALMKNKKLIKFEKGVNLDVREIAKILRNTDYDWALFHTRLASIGEKCDENCHPFKRGNMVMAMNGTERSVSFLSKINDITDTTDANIEYALPNYITKIEKHFDNKGGFYYWNSIKYFLYEYEYQLAKKNNLDKVSWEMFTKTEKDKVSIEHI